MPSIELKGFSELQQKLKDFPVAIQKEVSNEILASALTIVRNAQATAPFDTGRLAGRITFQQISPLDVEVVSPINYSAYQEFGTGNLVSVPFGFEALAEAARGSGTRQSNMAPHPFLIPALLDEQPLLLSRIQDILNTSLTS